MSAQVAVVGATGYVGRLISNELARRGVSFVAVGRDPEKLERLAEATERRQVADVADEVALVKALEGCRAVCSCVGPFIDKGEPVVRVALAAGTHYIDTTGEQAFVRTVFDRYDAAARQVGVALVPAMGVDPLLGDIAATLAARSLGSTPEVVEVFHQETDAAQSDGTRRTIQRAASMPSFVWRDGRPAGTAFGAEVRSYQFPHSMSRVVLFPGAEILTVARHTGAANVASFMAMPAEGGVGLAAPPDEPLEAIKANTGGPSPDERKRHRYTKVAEARAGTRSATCIIEGHDVYGTTTAASQRRSCACLTPPSPPRARWGRHRPSVPTTSSEVWRTTPLCAMTVS